MQTDRDPRKQQPSQQQVIPLHDYAGDEQDERKAKEQANQYRQEVEKATSQQAGKEDAEEKAS